MKVGDIPLESVKDDLDPSFAGLKVRVEAFTDTRSDPAVGEIDGRSLMLQGNIEESIRIAFERAFVQKGVLVSNAEAPALEGELSSWKVSVTPGFPMSEAEAKASIRVQVLNERGESIYQGNYSGATFSKHPMMSQSHVEGILAGALGEAVAAAVNDSELISAIYRFSWVH